MSEKLQPEQTQDRQPGREADMNPRPEFAPRFPGAGRLKNKVALISGGDSGIGRAVAVAMAREGADIAIVYPDEEEDARETLGLVENEGHAGLAISGDIGDEAFCRDAVAQVIERFGRLDVLVNNAAEQHEVDDLTELSSDQLERAFRTNVFGYFFLTKAALPHLKVGAAIVNTTSVTACQGHDTLLAYATTRGARFQPAAVDARSPSAEQYAEALAPGFIAPFKTTRDPSEFRAAALGQSFNQFEIEGERHLILTFTTDSLSKSHDCLASLARR